MSKSGNGFTEKTFEFFEGLEANNDREWFDQHRQTYHEYGRDPFARFLEDVSARLDGTALPLRGGSQTMFRINRDLRFTDDPRPYNESVSGLLTPDGTKNEDGRLLYLYLGSSGGGVGGGMHRPKAAALEPVRRRIVDEPDEFAAVLDELASSELEIDLSEQVKTMPRGFAEHSDHRHAEEIRATQLLAMRPIPKTAWLDDTAIDRVVEAAEALSTLYDFIEAAA